MLNSKDYQKLFQIELSYLVSDLFSQHYKTLNCLLICDKGLWTSYLPKSVVEKTLQEGIELFSEDTRFSKFETDFEYYISESKEIFEKVLGEELRAESAENFLLTLAGFWKFYSKTEFFYTDRVAIIKDNEIVSKNLKIFEQIKNDGRLTMNSFIFEEGNYFAKFLNKISEKFGISMEHLKSYSIKEIVNLFNNEKVSEGSISKRKDFFVMQGDGESILYKEGSEFRGGFINFIAIGEKELKGVVANKGVVSGKVKIFPPTYYSDFSILTMLIDEMEVGDVLVAETTSPELMTACKKAGAILTNQGGLLSHAAIVSRELNIPCIVGMENVVQILKDGDMVEVDADKGIVSFIN